MAVAVAIEDGKMIIGGGATATEIALGLRDYAQTIGGREQIAIEEFANAILSLNGNYSRVFIDQSHLPREPLDGAKLILAGAHAILSSPAGTLALIAIIIALSTSLLWKKPKTKKETAMLPTVKT